MNAITEGAQPDGYVMDRSSIETERLRAQSRLFEPATRVLLEDVGLGTGMSALDVGCGGADVMRLMAERVGAPGSVTGMDLDGALGRGALKAMEPEVDAKIDFIEGDVTSAAMPHASFDLTFARFLLIHLEDPLSALKRMWEWTAPGGHMAVIDFDFRTLPGDSGRATEQLFALQSEVFARAGRDMHFGGRLPALIERACGAGPDRASVSGLLAPLDAIAPFLAATFRSLLPAARAFGLETEERSAGFFAALEEETGGEPRYLLGPLVISAWKRRARL